MDRATNTLTKGFNCWLKCGVEQIHKINVIRGYRSTSLPTSLIRKYENAAKNLVQFVLVRFNQNLLS
jgi:hypothetical protein